MRAFAFLVALAAGGAAWGQETDPDKIAKSIKDALAKQGTTEAAAVVLTDELAKALSALAASRSQWVRDQALRAATSAVDASNTEKDRRLGLAIDLLATKNKELEGDTNARDRARANHELNAAVSNLIGELQVVALPLRSRLDVALKLVESAIDGLKADSGELEKARSDKALTKSLIAKMIGLQSTALPVSKRTSAALDLVSAALKDLKGDAAALSDIKKEAAVAATSEVLADLQSIALPTGNKLDVALAALSAAVAAVNADTNLPGAIKKNEKLQARISAVLDGLQGLQNDEKPQLVINVLKAYYGDMLAITNGRMDASALDLARRPASYCSALRTLRTQCQGSASCTGGADKSLSQSSLCGYDPAPYAEPRYKGLVVIYQCAPKSKVDDLLRTPAPARCATLAEGDCVPRENGPEQGKLFYRTLGAMLHDSQPGEISCAKVAAPAKPAGTN